MSLEQKMSDFFKFEENDTDMQGEIRAGITTFLTMAYILLVNPAMLAVSGIPFDDALFATAIAAFVGCTVMGLWANKPYALAPGMGLNAYFVFAVVIGMGISWQVALAAVLVEGVIFMIISIPQIGWRTKMINAIPKDLKIATGAGIGMFLAIIGLREMGWIQDDGATLVNLATTESFGYDHGAVISMVALVAITVMMAKESKEQSFTVFSVHHYTDGLLVPMTHTMTSQQAEQDGVHRQQNGQKWAKSLASLDFLKKAWVRHLTHWEM